MGFLRETDYLTLINKTNLDTILRQARGIIGDPEILSITEAKSIAQIKNSLRGRYKIDSVFDPFKSWSLSTDYVFNDRLVWEATDYSALTVYTSGDLLEYGGFVYEKNATTLGYVAGTLPTNTTFFTNRGVTGIYYITPPINYDIYGVYAVGELVTFEYSFYVRTSTTSGYEAGLAPTNTTYWELVTDLTPYAVSGVWPNDTDSWTYGDNRDLSIVECVIDYTLYDIHAIINPRQIPDLRQARWEKQVKWLSDIRKGQYDMGLPEYGAQTGYRIRFGSSDQTTYYY